MHMQSTDRFLASGAAARSWSGVRYLRCANEACCVLINNVGALVFQHGLRMPRVNVHASACVCWLWCTLAPCKCVPASACEINTEIFGLD